MLATFDIKQTLAIGWPVLSVLLVFSIFTVAIFFECWGLARWVRKYIAHHGADAAFLTPYLDRFDQRLAILGTIANAAPFVGLLGTVIGIIRAFNTISQAAGSGGGMTLVAAGISEALVATAAGLAVAIPASMIFNFYSFQREKLGTQAGIS